MKKGFKFYTPFGQNINYTVDCQIVDALEVCALGKWTGKLCVVLWLSVCFLWTASSAFGEVILEYKTPTPNSSPADLAIDSQGNVWFTEWNGNRIGRLVPPQARSQTSDGITEYELPHPNSKPRYLTIAKNGMIWFTEGANRIGRLNPHTGRIKEYDIPTPHSEPFEIAEAPDGSIWFLEFRVNKIGRLNPETGRIVEFPIGPGNPRALIIKDGKIWYTQGGMPWVNIFFNKLGYMEIKTSNVREIKIPPEKSVPHGMSLDHKTGDIWFTEINASKLARLDRSGPQPKVVEYFLGKNRFPKDICVHDHFVWFTVSGPAAIGRMDLSKAKPGTNRGLKFFNLLDPKDHPKQITQDSKGQVWFTLPGDVANGKYNDKIGLLIP